MFNTWSLLVHTPLKLKKWEGSGLVLEAINVDDDGITSTYRIYAYG